MFDKFSDYMQYLLPSAFKRQKKQNQLLIYCRVIGRLYDNLLQSILRLREETILATCSHEMLEIFGNDYDMPRMQGETNEMYRKRLQMKALVAEAAGTQKGILYALASVGYYNCTITPLYLTDSNRWAEIRINIFTASVDIHNPIAFKCVVAEVMKVKKASTLPHWRFYYPVEIWHTDINKIRVAVRFILFVQFWSDCIYNGQNCYDGTIRYNARRNYKTNTVLINRMHLYTGQRVKFIKTGVSLQLQNNNNITAAVRNCFNISFWGCAVYDGDWRYNGTLQYDAQRRYGLHMAVAVRADLHTMQTVRYSYHMLYIKLAGREDAKAGIKNKGYAVKEPEPARSHRVRIHMEIFFPAEIIDNISVETSRHVAYYDGTLRYDGTARYDALYRKEGIE